MKQYSNREFIKILNKNGYYLDYKNGGHSIYKNNEGNHISIPLRLKCVIARRLIKENNLKE